MNVNKTVRGSLALIRAIFSRKVGFWTLLAICASIPGTLAFWFISRSSLMGVSEFFIALFLFASLFFIIAVPRIESEHDNNNANSEGETCDCAKNRGGKSNGNQ